MGLTGNFGAGKSTVAQFFKEKGAVVLSADSLAHEAFRKNHPLHQSLREIFPEIKGELDRRRVAKIVFSDPRRRRALERRIHPYVLGRLQGEIQKRRGAVAVAEVPLLFESGFDRACDRVVVVWSRPAEIFARLRRRGVSKPEVRARWKAQRAVGGKLKRAHFGIDNSGSRVKTRRQVGKIWKKLTAVID